MDMCGDTQRAVGVQGVKSVAWVGVWGGWRWEMHGLVAGVIDTPSHAFHDTYENARLGKRSR